MLIATYFKRPNAPVTIDDAVYFFKPIVPDDSESVHVCEVADTKHIQMLLSYPEGYYILDAEAKGPSAARPTSVQAVAVAQQDEPESGPEQVSAEVVDPSIDAADGDDDEEVTQQAAQLIDNSWQKVLQLVKGGGIPQRVLESALRQELAKAGEDEPRQSVVKALRAQIGE